MAFQQVPDTAEAQVIGSLGGEPVMNTYHMEVVGGYTQTDLDNFAAAVDAQMGTGMLLDLSVRYTYERTDVVGLDQLHDLTASSALFPGVGSINDAPLPGNVAFVVRKNSGLTGRNARGRVFLAGVPQSYRDTGGGTGNTLQVAFANAYAGYVDAIRIAIDALGTPDPVIVSRWLNKTKRSVGVTFPWVSSDYSTRLLGSQRERMS